MTAGDGLLDSIHSLFIRRGGERYSGEPVTQLEHALQTAHRAEQARAGADSIAAALLHDIGHLLEDHCLLPTLRGVDDQHQLQARFFLSPTFGEPVIRPIEMHVEAKRYLCATRPAYPAALSEDSKRSLALQGGVFSERFIRLPYARDAVRLRAWDDLAKAPELMTPTLEHYLEYARRSIQFAGGLP